MDWGDLFVQATVIIGVVAALITILTGIYDLRERRQKSRASSSASAVDALDQGPASPTGPPQAEVHPAASPTRSVTNLPTPSTRLIGREDELAELKELLLRPDVRLVTLTGPAGIGKTRLALQLAAELSVHYPDGVCFVALGSVTDPNLTVPTIAQVLDVREQGGQPLLDMLKNQLAEKRMLLVLDNFEQVVTAAPVIAELLAAAPKLEILATSREVLHLYGEHAFAVPPLTLPDLETLPAGTALMPTVSQYEAVRLFVERAQAVKADFALTDETAAAVAEIACRLDGLPLAIELAAARIRLLSPPAMLQRLVRANGGSSLRLLTGGARDLPARQQTLRSTIAWSYDLLNEPERTLFQRLGVFAGGWTLEAAEAVCTAPGELGVDVLDGLESLVAKSLVQQLERDGDARFTMLQTIREYALERLEETGLAEATRQSHANYYLGFTGQAEPQLYGPAQVEWLKRLDTEHDNLRAALDWALEHGQPELALRLASNLAWFWHLRGRVSEGRGWLEAALAGDMEPTQARARTLLGLGDLASNQADWPAVLAAVEESVSIARALGDRRLLARALAGLTLFRVRGSQGSAADTQALADESLALARSLGDPWTLGYVLTVLDIRNVLIGDFESGSTLGKEALACFEEAGDQWGIVLSLRHIGMGAIVRGDYAAARLGNEQALEATRALGDRLGQAYTLNYLGDIERMQGDYGRAAAYYEESLALYRDLGLNADIPASLHNLGYTALARGDAAAAWRLQTESLALHRQAGNKAGMLETLSGLAAVARVSGEPARAARLFGAVEALRAVIGAPVWPAERVEYDRQVSALRAQLDETALASAWAEGRAMTLEQAIAEALEAAPAGR